MNGSQAVFFPAAVVCLVSRLCRRIFESREISREERIAHRIEAYIVDATEFADSHSTAAQSSCCQLLGEVLRDSVDPVYVSVHATAYVVQEDEIIIGRIIDSGRLRFAEEEDFLNVHVIGIGEGYVAVIPAANRIEPCKEHAIIFFRA